MKRLPFLFIAAMLVGFHGQAATPTGAAKAVTQPVASTCGAKGATTEGKSAPSPCDKVKSAGAAQAVTPTGAAQAVTPTGATQAVTPTGAAQAVESKPAKPAAPAMPVPEVEMVAATRKSIELLHEVPGRVQAMRTAEVRARVDGIVEKRVMTEGRYVRAGALLFMLDDRMLKANVELAQATLDKSRAELLLARQTLERYQPLAAENAISKQELDQAAAQVKKAEAEEALAKANLSKANIDLGYATVTAPIPGRIGRTLVSEGTLVSKANATHMATIEQLDPIWINFTQSSTDLLRLNKSIREGQVKAISKIEVRLVLDDDSVYPITGKLVFTDALVDPSTGSVTMRGQFANPKLDLLPGQFVRVQYAAATTEGITVPQRAVQTTPQGQVVSMLDAESKVVFRPVKTGGFSSKDWIIREGLEEGEMVIVNGLQKVRPGTLATPKK